METNLILIDDYQTPKLVDLNIINEPKESKIAIAVDGNIVNGYNETMPQPTASTAKMILGLAIMQIKPFAIGEKGETITLTEEDYNRYIWYLNNGGSTTMVTPGEEISQYDALMSVFLASSNNMADSLAIWAFGSIDNYRDFATKMLKEWGINQTVLGEDASGFNEATISTATDLAQIGNKVLENEILKEIVGTKSYTIPIAGTLTNTNGILGQNRIIGVKTGYIGDISGYCLVSGYLEEKHIITIALLNAKTRSASFDDSLTITKEMQDKLRKTKLVGNGQTVGHYESWWTGKIDIKTTTDFEELAWSDAEISHSLKMNKKEGKLTIEIQERKYDIEVKAEDYQEAPTLFEKILHIFGWNKNADTEKSNTEQVEENIQINNENNDMNKQEDKTTEAETRQDIIDESFTNAPSDNCTIKYGTLMLINPNYTVENDFIAKRKTELVSLYSKYGIVEGVAGNGDNLLDAEAATHINEMVNAYKEVYPGHTLETRSCFRSVGTNCGRLCAATGASDHHTGLTCDLLDPVYGTSLDTSTYDQHPDWQWLKANSYKYGFIDRFPEAWAGGSMDEPLNVDENGSTGLFETWHYRYVGIDPATEIATGKYNNGEYDSLEHYLKARGLLKDLKNGTCE